MDLDTGKRKFISIVIDFSKGFPFTINMGTSCERHYPSLTEMLHPDDIPLVTEMFSDVTTCAEKVFETHCRFLIKGEYRWFFLSCRPVFTGFGRPAMFEGMMGDVSTYLESAGDDHVLGSYRKRHDLQLSELRKGALQLDEVLDRNYLVSIQTPFEKPGLYSGIFSADGTLICSAGENGGTSHKDLKFKKKKWLRINHLESGYWLLCASTQELLDENIRLWDTLTLTVSQMANAFYAVLSEMDNSQNANKLLGENIEEQILINNIYAIIMKSRKIKSGLSAVLELVGEYFKLDRIAIVDIDGIKEENDYWNRKELNIIGPLPELKGRRPWDFPKLYSDIQTYSDSFGEEEDNALRSMGVKSYAAFKMYDLGNFGGMICYEMLREVRIWTSRERKQLRNISQIISSVMMQIKTQQKFEESQLRMQQLAFYDPIYQVPNRTKLGKDLSAVLKKEKPGTLIAFKVSNLTNIVSVSGHTYADLIMRGIAQYLSRLPVENLTVYYFANAIFMLHLPYCVDEEAQLLCRTLIRKFSKPWAHENDEVHIDCSLGIARYPINGRTPEDICRAASIAMYRAREFKKSSYAYYTGALVKTRSFAANLEEQLRKSVSNNMQGFVLKFQPSFYSEDESVFGCETLLRWNAAEYGDVPNSTLLPLIQSSGLSYIIDGWILEKACRFCREVQESGLPDFKVSVKLTETEFPSNATMSQIEHAIEAVGISPESLVIDIPTRHFSTYSDSFHVLSTLKAVGVTVAADARGAADLSINLLKNPYIDIISVARSLFLVCEKDFDRELIDTFVHLAHLKSIPVCVKGIENEEQLKNAQSHRVDIVQGYYCSKPLLAEEAKEAMVNA